MKLRIKNPIAGSTISAQVSLETNSTTAFTEEEKRALTAIGEPSVEVGGGFDSGSGLTFTLPEREVSFPSGFPVVQRFSLDDSPDAQAQSVLFLNTIVDRVTEAMTDVRDQAAALAPIDEVLQIDTTP